jgi:tripartite-type tricarboxylate transporter receptor subunit TctC
MKTYNIKTIIVGIILSIMTLPTLAAQQVKVYWPFAATSAQGMMIRELIDDMNKKQDKYQFIFTHKPGAGGSVAATSVLNDNTMSLMVSTSSFYIRPLLYKDSHDISNFNMINSVCTAQPVIILSKNKNLLEDSKSKDVNIGVLPGSITALLVRSIKKNNPTLRITEIPFKGTPESYLNMLGGHIDGSIDFLTKQTVSGLASGVSVLGITGVENHPGLKTFNRQGIKGMEEIVNDYQVFVNKNMDRNLQVELNALISSVTGGKVKTICENDFGYIKNLSLSESEKIHLRNQQKWTLITAGVEKE